MTESTLVLGSTNEPAEFDDSLLVGAFGVPFPLGVVVLSCPSPFLSNVTLPPSPPSRESPNISARVVVCLSIFFGSGATDPPLAPLTTP